jgi:hypothetical protein
MAEDQNSNFSAAPAAYQILTRTTAIITLMSISTKLANARKT